MKIVADAEELESLEKLSDAELCALVRDGFSKFRRGRDKDPDAEDEPDVGGLKHGAPSNASLESGASRTANRNPGATDSARAAIQHTQDVARQAYEARLQEDERIAEAEKLVPGIGRLR